MPGRRRVDAVGDWIAELLGRLIDALVPARYQRGIATGLLFSAAAASSVLSLFAARAALNDPSGTEQWIGFALLACTSAGFMWLGLRSLR